MNLKKNNLYKSAFFAALFAVSLMTSAGAAHADVAMTFTSPSDLYQETGATGNIVGWSFTANQDLFANKLGVFDTDRDIVMEPNHFVGLWDSSGNLLASATINEDYVRPNGFSYHWADISATRLTSGQTYYVGAVMGSDYYTASIPESLGFGYGAPTPFGNLSVSPYISYQADAFYYLANGENPNGITFGSASTTTGLNGSGTIIGGLGGNLDITPVPVPAAVYLFGSGLAGLVGLRRKMNMNQ